MPEFAVTVIRTLEQSACLLVRARTADSAASKVRVQIENGVTWEELTKNLDVEEFDSITIEEVDEA